MEKVIGYVRVSTGTQKEKGYGLEAQLEAIKQHCKAKGYELVEVFKDEGKTGTKGDFESNVEELNREGLNDLLGALNSDIKKIVVMNTSRLWRNDTAKVIIRRKVVSEGAEIESIEQHGYSVYVKDPNDFLVNGMMELLDEYDRMSINIKLSKGRREKVKSGVKACGTAPLGYKWIHDGVKKPIVVVDEATAHIVKDIFKWYQEHKSIGKVQKQLAAVGYTTQKGKEFSAMSVRNILVNRFYVGEVKYLDKHLQGQHEPLINKITFGKVQAQLTKNKRN